MKDERARAVLLHTCFTGAPYAASVLERPSASSPRPLYTLFTAPGCHWCERARQILATLRVSYRECDIAGDEAVAASARGAAMVFPPVLWDGNRVVAYGRFSEGHLRQELRR